MPSAASIVARSYPDKIIGIENALPWHLRTDLQLFKQRTQGHAVIMGRKTFESIGKPLPKRTNIILSRSEPAFLKEFPALKWAINPETALFLADVESIISGSMKFFVIGGDQIYKVFEKYINSIFVTDVYCGNINGDAKFELDFGRKDDEAKTEWIIRSEDDFPKTEFDEYPFRITHYVRRKPFHRYRVKEELMGREPDFAALLERYEARLEQAESDQLDFFD
ncbi:dihydrofolate reductase [Rhizobium aethiopicum]|uniref:dihydrofolate reductase n=1 Tax=Rhizobium aethiopicum TaxID=1138170 RepID=A0A1C3XYU4_9HYPH|nr:dihydrofolate reductase [Rhizobium aethiopicum]SCB57410.1 dihydrofolate reductase [Rhizobium aethiopicum]